MATNTETLHDIFTHQVYLRIKSFVTDDGVDGLKEIFIHCGW